MSAYSNYCRATGMVVSPALIEQRDAASFLKELVAATNSDFRWSNGLLAVVPYGDQPVSGNGFFYAPSVTPLYDVTEDDLLKNQGSAGSGSGTSGAPIICVRKRKSDMLNNIKVEYLDRSNNYDPVAIEAKDQASIDVFGLRASSLKQLHFFNIAAAAQQSAMLQLNREQIPNTYVFTLGPKFILPDVMDILTLTRPVMGLIRQPVRITEIQENGDGTLTFTAEEFLGTAASPRYGAQATTGYAPNYEADPGSINTPIIFEPTDELGGGLQIWAAISGSKPALWGGCNVYASYDGLNYLYMGQIRGPSRMGHLSGALETIVPAASGPTIDVTNVVAVDLTESAGSLLSASETDFLALNTKCFVDGEIISYKNADLSTANKYNLSRLIRGAYGSKISAHANGAPFARLDQSIFAYPFDQSRIGSSIQFKFQSFNIYGGGLQSLADVSQFTFTITGVALTSPLPSVANVRSAYIDNRSAIAWDEISDFRPVSYEIRLGNNPATALRLGALAHPPFTIPGNGTYWISGVSQPVSGLTVYSETWTQIEVSGATLVANVIATRDEQADGWPGIFTGTVGKSGMTIRTGGSRDLLGDADILGTPDILNLGGQGNGTYEIAPARYIDAGRLAPCQVTIAWLGTSSNVSDNLLSNPDILNSPDFLGNAGSDLIDIYPEISWSITQNIGDVFNLDPVSNPANDAFAAPDIFNPDISFSPWQKYQPGVYVGRVFRARLVLETKGQQTIALALKFQFTVDVKDRVDIWSLVGGAGTSLTDVTIPNTGLVIVFAVNTTSIPAAFNGGPGTDPLPHIQITNVNGQTYSFQLTSFTKSGVTITALQGGIAVNAPHTNITIQGW
jgi:hypothetical protein